MQFARVVATSCVDHGQSPSRLCWRGIYTYLDKADESLVDITNDDDTAQSIGHRRHVLDFKTAGDCARGQVDIAA